MTTIIELSLEKQMTVLVLDTDGTPATGKTVNVSIRRATDGKYWEGTGSTWEVAKQYNAMTEVGTGLYKYDFTSTGVGSTEETFVAYYHEATIPAYGVEEFMSKNIFSESVSILADTNELQTDWANGGRLDNILIAARDAAQFVADTRIMYGATVVADLANTSSTFKTTLSGFANDYWKNMEILMFTGASAYQVRKISAYDDSTGFITVSEPFTAYPGDNAELYIFAAYHPETSLVPSDIADAVWDALRTAYTGVGTTGEAMAYLFDELEDNIRGTDGDDLETLSDQLDALALALGNVDTDVTTIVGKLPTNYIMGSGVLTDKDDEIDAIFNKLPINFIMGSSISGDKDGTIDNIYADTQALLSDIADVLIDTGTIKPSLISASGTVTVTSGSTNTFESDLTETDGYWTDMQVLMLTGANAGQVRRISGFTNLDGMVTVSASFANNPTLNDTFVVIGRVASAGSTLTESSIANYVWEELLTGHATLDSAAVWIKNLMAEAVAIKVVVDAIEVDTQDIQSRLPATLIAGLMRAHTQAQDNLALTAQQTLDVRAQMEASLVAYDAIIPADLDAAVIDIKANDDANTADIISEVNANEVKIDAIQSDITNTVIVDLNAIISTLGVPPISIYQSILDAIDEIHDNETLILNLDGDLAAHDLAIKTLIGIPLIDLIKDMNNRFDTVDADNLANYNAIIQIQNNITTVFIVPSALVRPDTSTKPYRMVVLNYDNIGHMEDFDDPPTITGTYVSGGAYFSGTATRDDPTKVGEYYFDIDVAFDDTLGAVQIKCEAEEAGEPRVLIRTSEVTDYDDELAEIKADTAAIFVKVDAGTPSPTIPALITQHDIDIKAQLTQTEIDIITEVEEAELNILTAIGDSEDAIIIAIDEAEAAIIGEIDENQAILEVMRDTPFLRLSCPSIVAQNNGYSRIDDVLDADIPIGATVIPVNAGTPSFFPDSGFIVVDDGVDREILEYSSTTETSFVLVTPTTILHVEGTPIYALIDATFKLFIESQDGDVYRQATAIPSLTILNEFGTEETENMVWDAATNSYSYTKQYIATEYLAGKRNVIVTALVGTLTKVAFATYELLDRPASQQSLDEALGGGLMPDTFVFDHDGWKDNANILHEWTDVMEGPLHDDTGKPATGILVRAFLKGDDGKYLLVNNPPFQNYSNIFGHYRGSLEAGTYLFAFYKDNHKWKEVERIIG